MHKRAASHGQPIERIGDPASKFRAWIRSLRPHQWLKNLLVFVPLVAAQEAGDFGPTLNALLAFIAFSLAASAVYVLNDLLDLPSDRKHERKRMRPFASGTLSVRAGLFSAGVLLFAALLTAFYLPPFFTAILLFYILITSAYSFRLKRRVIVDVILLAGLYTLRVIAGSAATDIAPSFWLLAFSMFLFLSLGIVKRYSELQVATDDGSALPGRGYVSSDLPVLALGASSGLMAIMVLALFINSPAVVEGYAEARWTWLVPPIMLYWVARLWMKTHRGEVDEDPVIFAARDKQSLIIMGLLAAVFSAAVFGLRLPG